jgi:hypothetical protein
MHTRDFEERGSASSSALEHADAILVMVIGAAVVPHLLNTLLGDVALRTPASLLGASMSAQPLVASLNVLAASVAMAILAGLALMCMVLAATYARRGPERSACVPVYAASAVAAVGGLLLL